MNKFYKQSQNTYVKFQENMKRVAIQNNLKDKLEQLANKFEKNIKQEHRSIKQKLRQLKKLKKVDDAISSIVPTKKELLHEKETN